MSQNNDSFNYNNDTFSFLGPIELVFSEKNIAEDDSEPVKYVISVALGIFMVLSIVGNVCTCTVIAKNRSMRTPTNCYLFNLAVTDLLTALFVPMEIYVMWEPNFYPLGEVGCHMQFVIFDCLCNCSVLTIAAFTIERYIVVIKPFMRQKLLDNSRVCKIIAVIWVISCSFCMPDIFYIDLLERKKYVYCYITFSYTLKIMEAIEVFVFFVIPMTIIFVLYILISIKLKSTQARLKQVGKNGKLNREKAVKMLAAVAASFFICWSPYCVLRIMFISSKYKYEDFFDVWKILNYVFSTNAYMSAAINPILYSLMSQKFRQAFKDLLKNRRTSNISYNESRFK